jgi:hypothetical protein
MFRLRVGKRALSAFPKVDQGVYVVPAHHGTVLRVRSVDHMSVILLVTLLWASCVMATTSKDGRRNDTDLCVHLPHNPLFTCTRGSDTTLDDSSVVSVSVSAPPPVHSCCAGGGASTTSATPSTDATTDSAPLLNSVAGDSSASVTLLRLGSASFRSG